MSFVNICTIIVLLIVIVSLIIFYIPDKAKNGYHPSNKEAKNINKQLTILSSNTTPKKKARAFTKLIQYSYVLIHTLVNEGNKYHDNKQVKHFCNSLTQKNISKLLNLKGDGNNE